MLPQDFSKRKTFPGNSGNNFDLVFKPIDAMQFLFAPLFAILLFALAFLAARFDLTAAIILFCFNVGDWIMISMLPRAGKSFGPPKPPVFLLALLRAPFALLPFPFWISLQFIGTVLVIYSFWIEPHRISLTHQTLQSPKLGFKKPLRVLHLADIHVERITQRERALIEMVRALAPDLILFSGDFLNLSYTHDALAQEHARSVLVELEAPLGVYVVSGSPAVDPPEVVSKLLEGMPNIRWLRQERAVIEHEGRQIEIVGLDCTHKPFIDAPKLTETLNGTGGAVSPGGDVSVKRLYDNTFRILLYHTPDLAPDAARAGLDLQLSGHTHGGQVRIPFYGAVYAGSLYGKKFESGRRQVGALTLYVSRGIGLEGGGAPRLRFNCAPEVILWEIG